MTKAFGDYRRVDKNGRGSLWIGPDHLLIVESNGFLLPFTEKYRRIDFANIQDLTWTRTRRRARFAVLFGILFALLLWALLANLDSIPATVIWGSLCLLTGTILGINFARGETVDLRIRTAVQLLRLRPITRRTKAEALIQEIAPVCLAHQGTLSETELAAASLSGSTTAPTSSAAPGKTAPPQPPVGLIGVKPPWPGSNLVRWALFTQTIAGLAIMAELFTPNLVVTIAVYAVSIAAMVLIVAALTRSLRFQLPAGLKTAVVGSTIMHGVGLVLGFVLFVAAAIKLVPQGGDQMNQFVGDPYSATFNYLGGTSFQELGWIGWSLLLYGAFSTCIAAIGIPAALSVAPGSTPTPPPVPPSVTPPPVPPSVTPPPPPGSPEDTPPDAPSPTP